MQEMTGWWISGTPGLGTVAPALSFLLTPWWGRGKRVSLKCPLCVVSMQFLIWFILSSAL